MLNKCPINKLHPQSLIFNLGRELIKYVFLKYGCKRYHMDQKLEAGQMTTDTKEHKDIYEIKVQNRSIWNVRVQKKLGNNSVKTRFASAI